MTHANWCEGCSQAHDCKHIYERLGHAEGPSVVPKALIAFVVPIGAFVAGLGLFGRLLGHVLAGPYRTWCTFALALCTTAALMLGLSVLTKRLDKKRC